MEILLVEDDKALGISLVDLIEEAGHHVRFFNRADAALVDLAVTPVDLVITDVRLPGGDGIQVLERARLQDPPADVLVMTGFATVEQAVSAMQGGAFSYLQKPFPNEALLALISRIMEMRSMREELSQLRKAQEGGFKAGFVGSSAHIANLRKRLKEVEAGEAPILFVGESGTGKGLAAEALHQSPAWRERPFVPVACGAIPASLLEGELYGYRKGAFTGADEDRKGLLGEVADGILFLDDVDDLPLEAQASILRVLQEREYLPLGSASPVPFTGRVIAASKQDLVKMVRSGEFREDLYYRLEVLTLNFPPLREHLEDIPELVAHFLKDVDPTGRRDVPATTLQALCDHDWPGNVRELENAVKRAVALCGRAKWLQKEHFLPGGPLASSQIRKQELLSLAETVRNAERDAIRLAMATSEGKRAEAAALLGISRKALWQKAKELGI